MVSDVSCSKNGRTSWKDDAWSTKFRAFTFWLVFQPGSHLTSSPTRWLNSVTLCVCPGFGTVGAFRAAQNSHANSRAALTASSEACPCRRIRIKSPFEGCPRFLCNFNRACRSLDGSTGKSDLRAANASQQGSFSAVHSGTSDSTIRHSAEPRRGVASNKARTNCFVYLPACWLTDPIPGHDPATGV